MIPIKYPESDQADARAGAIAADRFIARLKRRYGPVIHDLRLDK